MKQVRILHGDYRGIDVSDIVFPLVKEFKIGANGPYITVDSSSIDGLPNRNIRISVAGDDCYEYIGAERTHTKETTESDEQILARLSLRFDMLEDMTYACKTGDIRALIVSGPPGVGKSYGVDKVLNRSDLVLTSIDQDLENCRTHEVIKGTMSALGLYMKLFEYSSPESVLVLDDCDSVFLDDVSLNLLKAALDSRKVRTISWNTDNKTLASEDIPKSFEFKGSVIFITNMKFENVKSARIRDHLDAIESRCHYIDLAINTEREKVLRIKQIALGGMLDSHNLSREVIERIVKFVDVNKKNLRELSLRTVVKIADLARAFPNRWEIVAENTVMKR